MPSRGQTRSFAQRVPPHVWLGLVAVALPLAVGALATWRTRDALAERIHDSKRAVGDFVASQIHKSVEHGIPLAQAVGPLEALRFGQTGRVTLVDREGRVLLSGDPIPRDETILGAEAMGLLRQWHAGGVQYFSPTLSRREIAVIVPVPDHPWAVVVSQAEAEAFEPVARFSRGLLVGFAALVVAGLALTLYLVRDSEGYGQELRGKERETRRIIDSAHDAFVAMDEAGRIVDWNPQAEAIFGWTRAEALGATLADTIIPPRHRPAHREGLARFLATGEGPVLDRRIEIEALRRDGHEFPVELTISAVSEGKSHRFNAFLHDITERKRAQEKFRGLLESAPDAMVLVDKKGRIALVNSQTEKLFGYRREELLGQPVEMLVPQRFRDRHAGHRDRYFGETRVRPLDAGLGLSGVRKNGEEFPVEISLSPLETDEGVLVSSAIRDVTEQRRARERLARQAAALAETNQDLEAFCYSVSHDLRAPLRHIASFVDLLQRRHAGALDAQGLRYLATIARSAKRMGELIDDLLAFSRIGRASLRRERVELGPLVRDAIAQLEEQARDRSIDWQVAALPAATGDAAMLRVVLTNLLSNAVKYTRTRERAQIEVGCRPAEAGSVLLFVRDNGVGFDMKYAGQLFGVFQRLHRADEFEGTGVGLATVQRIVERHGGRTWAEGVVGEGATFYVNLPGTTEEDVA